MRATANPRPDRPLQLLGGLSPRQFMRRYWQRRPLVVRGAIADFVPPLARNELFALAGRDGVESRLVRRENRRWSLAHGPIGRRALPSTKQHRWTLLVQGVDLHDDAAHALLRRFRFVPDARLDDLMISWASEGGGVGPHVDSYDVFLLQASGQRRWRIAQRYEPALDPRAPLKVLRSFEPEQEHVLGPGDLLYLPPHWAHEGVAVTGDCMTCSIGMRTPQRGGLAAEMAQRLAETFEDATLYRDAGRLPAAKPAAIPPALSRFASDAVRQLATGPEAVARALGEVLSEPKAHVWFTRSATPWRLQAVALDRRTRMLYDAHHVFINGEAIPQRGKDATLLRRLADIRALDARTVRAASPRLRSLLAEWFAAGWLTAVRPGPTRRRVSAGRRKRG